MMKTFKIKVVRHGSFGRYDESQTIQARSAKMAMKKMMNAKDCYGRTFRQQMDYDRWANGYWYEIGTPELIEG